MTVMQRTGPTFCSGVTWHVSVPYSRVKEHIPCYELKWDENGKAERTGRYALLSAVDAAATQQVSDRWPIPDLSDSDPRVVEYDEFKERKRCLDRGDYGGGIPEQVVSERIPAEDPF